MRTDGTINTSTSSPPCPHSDGKSLPVCWDCAEEGHVNTTGEAYGGNVSPTWQKLKKFRRSFRFRDRGRLRTANASSPTGAQSSAPEVHPPQEGLEVGAQDPRRSQPGLIVVTGPQMVSPEDKLRWQPGHKSWGPESTRRKDSSAASTTCTMVWGSPVRRRALQILTALAFLTFAGVIIGVAVGLTQRKGPQ
jgi:hypothetical protein